MRHFADLLLNKNNLYIFTQHVMTIF